MRNKSTLAVLTLALCLVAGGLFVLSTGIRSNLQKTEPSAVSHPSSTPPISSEPEPPPPEPKSTTVRLVAAGDNLIHDNIYKQASTRAAGNGYDFSPVYERIAPKIAGADLAFINQETPLAEGLFPLSGYPMFNSPNAVGDEIVKVGFNVVNYANNHMFDKGEAGLKATMDFFAGKAEVTAMGAWKAESDMTKPIVVTKNEITFGFVPITEHTNGVKLPKETAMRYILSNETDLMKQQIELANANSDFTVVSIHWGTENSTEYNNNQLELAQMFADWGVDLVIGHHSHTLQPMEWRTGKDGNKMLITYSIGNLISSMLYPQHMLGGILDLDITKDQGTGETTITRAQLHPTVTQYDGAGRSNVRSYPFEEYTDELAAKHGVRLNYDYFGIDYFEKIIKENIPEEFRLGLKLRTA